MNDSFKHVWQSINASEHKKALEQLESMSTQNSDDTRNKKALMAMVLAKLGNYDEAIVHANNIIQTTTPIANDYNLLGNLLSKINNYSKAEEAYLEAIALNAHYLSAILNLAHLYYKQELYPQAEPLYQKILIEDASHNDAAYYLSSIYLKQHKVKKALSTIDPLFKQKQSLPRILNQWAQCQYLLGNHQVLINRLGTYNLDNIQMIDGLWYLANAYFQMSAYKKAILCAQFIKQLDPHYDQVNALLGHAYLHINDYDQALKYYLQENEYSKEPIIYFNIAVIMEAKQRQKEALEYYKGAIKLDPDYFDAYFNMGHLYLAQGAFQNAQTAYKKAQQLKPNSKQLQFILSALDGEQTAPPIRPPASFVENLFDQYAPYYDQHLQKTLHFQVPNLILTMLEQQHIAVKNSPKAILDLGCGSGLTGELLASYSKQLIGIDLSEKMLELAEQKNCYQELIQADIENIDKLDHSFDLIVASDVVPYLGSVDNLMMLIQCHLNKNSYVCFSYETLSQDQEPPYQLDKSLRYQHSVQYIHNALSKYGFSIISAKEDILRTNHKKPIRGEVILAQLK